MSTFLVAFVLAALVFLASVISLELGFTAAIIEIAFGTIGGNFFGIQTTPWIDFLAAAGSILLTFLAGTEVNVTIMRKNLRESLLIGGVSLLAPFLACFAFAYWGAGWTFRAAEIAGTALSTTSLAVVYAVLVQSGLSKTDLGKRIMAATLAVCGWWDFYSQGTLDYLARLGGPKKLLIGPWKHILPDLSLVEPVGLLELMVRWWDRWLRGRDNGADGAVKKNSLL